MKTHIKILLTISIIGIIIYLVLLFMKKKPNILKTEKSTLLDIADIYGVELAQNVERIYRLETRHFDSEQYKKSGSAGMLKHSSNFPFGWTSLSEYWTLHNKFKPSGFISMIVKGENYNYLKFDNFGGFYSLAEFLKKYNNNAGRWFSTNEEQQAEYIALLENINTKFV